MVFLLLWKNNHVAVAEVSDRKAVPKFGQSRTSQLGLLLENALELEKCISKLRQSTLKLGQSDLKLGQSKLKLEQSVPKLGQSNLKLEQTCASQLGLLLERVEMLANQLVHLKHID